MGIHTQEECPLCLEALDSIDLKLKPCQCGCQICVCCFYEITNMKEKEGYGGKCPGCRAPYIMDGWTVKTSDTKEIVKEHCADTLNLQEEQSLPSPGGCNARTKNCTENSTHEISQISINDSVISAMAPNKPTSIEWVYKTGESTPRSEEKTQEDYFEEVYHKAPIEGTIGKDNFPKRRAHASMVDHATSDLLPGRNFDTMIDQILEIGGGAWDGYKVQRALWASYNNPGRALDYLCSGALNAGDSGGGGTLDFIRNEALNAGDSGGGGTLDFIRNDREFEAIREMVIANPESLQPMLHELSKHNPQVWRLIQENREEFLQILEGGSGDAYKPPSLEQDDKKDYVDMVSMLVADAISDAEILISCISKFELDVFLTMLATMEASLLPLLVMLEMNDCHKAALAEALNRVLKAVFLQVRVERKEITVLCEESSIPDPTSTEEKIQSRIATIRTLLAFGKIVSEDIEALGHRPQREGSILRAPIRGFAINE